VSVAVRLGEPEQDDGLLEDRLEARADRDRAALANVDRRPPEGRLQRTRGRLGDRVVDGRHARQAAAEEPDRCRDAGRGDLRHERPERLEDPVRVLVRDEPAADLGVGMRGDDRL
jgi:hypothetical protein